MSALLNRPELLSSTFQATYTTNPTSLTVSASGSGLTSPGASIISTGGGDCPKRDDSAAQRAVRQALWRKTWERLLKGDPCPHASREWHPVGQNAAEFICRDCGLIVELGGKQ